jgi:hypothetical protein
MTCHLQAHLKATQAEAQSKLLKELAKNYFPMIDKKTDSIPLDT